MIIKSINIILLFDFILLPTEPAYMHACRNKIAAGQIAGYCPASRMATMQWSDELAYLATLNVLQCVMKHGKTIKLISK